MMEYSLLKNLKKRIRRMRRPMWTLGCMLLVLFAGFLWQGKAELASAAISGTPAGQGQQSLQLQQALEENSGPLSVKLHRIYVCGDETKTLGWMTGKQLTQLLDQNPDWKTVREKEGDAVVIEQQVDDLSERCKANAYIGIDQEGHLNLYDGVPKKEKVVRTFFQLDVNYMESNLPQDKLEQLAKGIRITDIDEYNSVLSTYSDYAVEKNEKVMNPSY